MRRKLIVASAVALMLLVGLGLLKVVDVALGSMALVAHPISPPGITAVTYRTSEFDATVRVNRWGFRGSETAIRPGQIVVLGDSFTYGWGLSEEDTWASRLRETIRAAGRPLDVYNLGQPGTDTLAQLEIARTYVPLLKPSVLVLSFVAGDDIADTMARSVRTSEFNVNPGWRQAASKVAETAFPNLLMTSFRAFRGTQQATANWGQLAAGLIAERRIALDPDMEREARAGNINPFLLNLASLFPDRNERAYSTGPEAEAARAAIIEAADALGRLVAQNGGKLVILSMPSAPFVDSTAMRDHRRLGFRISDASLSGRAPDAFAETLCRRTASRCVLMLDAMRDAARSRDVFFPLDGHINAAGSAVVAKHLAAALGVP